MNRYKKFRSNTIDAVAAACAAYRHFGNTVKKSELNDTSKTSKEMLLDHLTGLGGLCVTDADRVRAEEVIAYINQRKMLDTLAGRSNSPFFLSVAGLLEKDTVSSGDIGIVAWAPKLVDDLAKADDTNQDIRQTIHDSRYLGNMGKSIELEFHPLRSTFAINVNRFFLLGHDGSGNAISFWHGEAVNKVINIKGRVKRHDVMERYGNLKGTALNYVKVKK